MHEPSIKYIDLDSKRHEARQQHPAWPPSMVLATGLAKPCAPLDEVGKLSAADD
jgi:hypothetical protein